MEEKLKGVRSKATSEPKNARVAQFLAQLGGHKPAVARADHDALPTPAEAPRAANDPQPQ
jgi:hypothetical protein